MTTASVLKDYKAQVAKTDSDAYIGHLLWYMVSETSVSWTEFKDVLEAEGLKDFVPRAPRDEDVFRRVAPNGHRKRVSTTNDKVHVNYMIRQIKRGGGVCVKHIVAETVDSDGERLDYEEVFALNFNDQGQLVLTPIGAGDATAEEIALEIKKDFYRDKGRIDAAAIRNVVRRVLDQARAVNVRPTGGVYFVMPAYAHLIEALERVAGQIIGAFVHPLPLVDDRKQRDMLRRAYEAETIEEVDRSLAEIATLLENKDSKVTPDLYARLSSKFSGLLAKQAEYNALLEDALSGADSKLTILRKQMTSLLRRVE